MRKQNIICRKVNIMRRVAKFEKVSFEQFKKDMENYREFISEEKIMEAYKELKLPTRATKGSAGYDFYAPINLSLKADSTSKPIPTGIRCKMKDDVVLMIYPRSGLGFKYGISLANTTGVIDSDYYNAKNEGHIMVKFKNPGEELVLEKGTAMMQGIFIPYYITEDDEVSTERTGGFGSTDSKSE